MAQRIKKNDKVVVLTGRDKGKQGLVLEVLVKENRVRVQGINMVTRHEKPSQRSAGGKQRVEAPIHISNVAHADPKGGKATRVRLKTLQSGERALVSARSGEEIRRV